MASFGHNELMSTKRQVRSFVCIHYHTIYHHLPSWYCHVAPWQSNQYTQKLSFATKHSNNMTTWIMNWYTVSASNILNTLHTDYSISNTLHMDYSISNTLHLDYSISKLQNWYHIYIYIYNAYVIQSKFHTNPELTYYVYRSTSPTNFSPFYVSLEFS